jgi:hypothetical protein
MEKTENGRQTISRTIKRLLPIALIIMLAVVVTHAQVACLGKCEQAFAQCVNEGGVESFTDSCLEVYDRCVEACIGAAGEILG